MRFQLSAGVGKGEYTLRSFVWGPGLWGIGFAFEIESWARGRAGGEGGGVICLFFFPREELLQNRRRNWWLWRSGYHGHLGGALEAVRGFWVVSFELRWFVSIRLLWFFQSSLLYSSLKLEKEKSLVNTDGGQGSGGKWEPRKWMIAGECRSWVVMREESKETN